jgi:hypothetical protein
MVLALSQPCVEKQPARESGPEVTKSDDALW